MRWIIAGLFGAVLAILGYLLITGDHRWLWLGCIVYIICLLAYRPKGQLSLWEGLSLTQAQQDDLYVERQKWYQINRKLKSIEAQVRDYKAELSRLDQHTFEQLYMNQWRPADESDEEGNHD